MQQFAATWPDEETVQQLVGQLPWGHNIALLQKLKDPFAREWYARATTQHGWSRNVLIHQIDSRLLERQGQATTNFERALPAPQSELAQQLLKDPYNFDFLSLGQDALERDLERGLLAHLRDFMLELGVGFAFVGSQVHLEVGGEDFYPDLLFYLNKTRVNFGEKLRSMIEDYNLGSANIEDFFRELIQFGQDLNAEGQRAAREGLTEEELAIFDLVVQGGPDLSSRDEKAVKVMAHHLIEKLRSSALVLDWRKKQQTKACVKKAIRDELRALGADVYV